MVSQDSDHLAATSSIIACVLYQRIGMLLAISNAHGKTEGAKDRIQTRHPAGLAVALKGNSEASPPTQNEQGIAAKVFG